MAQSFMVNPVPSRIRSTNVFECLPMKMGTLGDTTLITVPSTNTFMYMSLKLPATSLDVTLWIS